MPFKFEKTPIEGVMIITPQVFEDSRGFFLESFKKSEFEKNGIAEDFVQDNHSLSDTGVLRGIHFQINPYAQGKLVRVIKGAVWDVAVDLRKDSPTYGQHLGIELNEDNNKMFYIPPGLGHGFLTLKDKTHFLYKCTSEYAPRADSGVRWDDPSLNIQWPISDNINICVSDKDQKLSFWEK